MQGDTKACVKCGKEFKKSRSDYTVLCPACRKKPKADRTVRMQLPPEYFRCLGCGKEIHGRREAFLHRDHTGHEVVPQGSKQRG